MEMEMNKYVIQIQIGCNANAKGKRNSSAELFHCPILNIEVDV